MKRSSRQFGIADILSALGSNSFWYWRMVRALARSAVSMMKTIPRAMKGPSINEMIEVGFLINTSTVQKRRGNIIGRGKFAFQHTSYSCR